MNRFLNLLFIALLLAGCQPAARPPLEGARMGGPFALTSELGQPFSDRDVAGKYRLVYFGYTYCPDVCPVDMASLMKGFAALEKSDPGLAARIQPLFITVDPLRDTPKVLREFTDAFHPRLIGLTGSEADIAAIAKLYGVYFESEDHAPGAPYKVNHNRMIILYGPKGEPLANISETGAPDEIAAEISKWAK